ncbi:MAG: gamma-glutamyltransferase family protein, partial [Polaromonas sp.]
MKHLLYFVVAPVAAAALLAGCAGPSSQFSYTVPAQPEGSSGYSPKPGWATTKFAVAAANPLATDAGYQVLKAGGSAIDAAIAVQMVLALVEPQSSGIGGGAFLLHASGSKVEAFDGRETAPASATENLFMGADGKPLAFYDGVVGGRSVGTPGTVRMLEMAHKQYGKLPWAQLFAPAIQLADGGFKVSARLNTLLKDEKFLKNDRTAAAYFYKADGSPVDVGSTLRNPALADVLRQIASKGSNALLTGPVAQSIVAKVQGHVTNPGKLDLNDLANYQAKKRDPICSDYSARGKAYVLCGMPPPSSGAIAVGQILGMLNNTPAATLGLVTGMGGVPGTTGPTPSADWLHLYTEASRLAFADRGKYLGDPDFVQPPGGSWLSLLDPGYLSERAKLIQVTGPSMKTGQPGVPGAVKTAYAPMADQPEYGTSHISIVDAYGNALAMTTTIEDQFGSRLMTDGGTGKAGGFLLNNELTDFSFAPTGADGKPVANRVQANKRPRSSMAPTLVFDKASNQLVMSGGSPGGALIIHFVAKTLYGVLNWGLLPQQAI